MSDWIDAVIYTVFIIAVWGWLPAWSARVARPMIADRNPDWMAGHPEAASRLAESRRFRWSCWLWGAASVAALLARYAGGWPVPLTVSRETARWEALKDLNSLLLVAGLFGVAVCAVPFSRRLRATVPLTEHRRATLEPRSIDDHVPRAVRLTVYGLVGLHLAAWITIGLSGHYASSAFWGGLLFQFAISGICAWLVVYAVQRRPGARDRIFGPAYRRTEVRAAFGAQLLPLMNGVARLYEQVTGTSSEDLDRLLHLGLVLLITVVIATIASRFRTADQSPGRPRWPRSATLAGLGGLARRIN
jgi:hypothetical protein